MTQDDLASAEHASDLTFLDAGRLGLRVGEQAPRPRCQSGSQAWIDRMRYFLEIDPEGCWVAAAGATVVGFAISQNRGRLWYLATYGVLPGHQGKGTGRQLLDSALAHADGRQGIFSATPHPGATRRYRLAGFSLVPQMRMTGVVDRSALPVVTGVREGRADDVEWMDELDERVRGAGHGPDHAYMRGRLRLMVSAGEPRGYVYFADAGPSLLAADDDRTACRLLWEALAASTGETLINCITIANEWAIDVGVAARLNLGQEGFIAVRGMPEPAPYLASGHFL